MLLITMDEWIGPGRRMMPSQACEVESKNKIISFATKLNLGEAIKRINNYQKSYNEYFSLAIEFSMLQVTEIEDLSIEQLNMVNVELVENLKQTFIEFE